jgi:hypothetical protein
VDSSRRSALAAAVLARPGVRWPVACCPHRHQDWPTRAMVIALAVRRCQAVDGIRCGGRAMGDVAQDFIRVGSIEEPPSQRPARAPRPPPPGSWCSRSRAGSSPSTSAARTCSELRDGAVWVRPRLRPPQPGRPLAPPARGRPRLQPRAGPRQGGAGAAGLLAVEVAPAAIERHAAPRTGASSTTSRAHASGVVDAASQGMRRKERCGGAGASVHRRHDATMTRRRVRSFALTSRAGERFRETRDAADPAKRFVLQ